MHISSSSNQPLQGFLPNNTAANSSQGSLANTGGTSSSSSASNGPPSESKDAAEGARVTLTATRESKGIAPEFVPIYAEIWKNGMKVAEIDVHGGVNSIDGLVASTQGVGGSGGPLLAARRAAEIIRSIGGEIRVGGQIMDSQTLEMRARLKMAYGA